MRFQIRWSRVSTNNVLDFLQPEEGRQYSMFLCTVDSISDAVHDNWHAAKCLTGMSAREHPVLCPPCCNLPAAIHSQQRENRAACLDCCWIISDKSISNNLYKISWLGKNSKIEFKIGFNRLFFHLIHPFQIISHSKNLEGSKHLKV